MSMLKHSARLVIKQTKRLLHKKRVSPAFIHKGVPYFAQWESPELVKDILDKKIDARDDPQWKQSGARTRSQYATWSWNGCGMACTKMILVAKTGNTVPLVSLGEKCAEYGGYPSLKPGASGLLYAPYVTFLKNEFALQAHVVSTLLVKEIIEALSDGHYVIASVSPQIRIPSSTPDSKGGHLILMVGYDLEKQILLFHNPSGIDAATQAYAKIAISDFNKFFSGRGIVIEK